MLIVGGGIAGLACALALARQGLACTVIEQAEGFRETGAGVQLGPNALRALEALGLRQAVQPLVSWPERIHMRDASSGRQLQSLSLGEGFTRRFAEGYACIHRGDLLKVLLDACSARSEIRYCVATSIERVEHRPEGVVAIASNGEIFEGQGLIAADGLWSKLRAQMLNDGPPRYSGDVALRALIAHDGSQQEVRLWLGPQLHVVTYPVRGGAALNIVAITEYAQGRHFRGWEEAVPKELLTRFADVHAELSAQLSKVDQFTAWPLFDREPIQAWSNGRVVLVGDAAHPSLQYLAQGACLALEDAVSLANHCGKARAQGSLVIPDVASAFAKFSAERYDRGARLIRTARSMGQLYHVRGVFRLARNFGMRVTPEWVTREMMAWLYEH